VLHHIAVDGWSVGVVLRDVGVAYAARVAGRVPVWEVLPVQCADHAVWQRELLGDEDDSESVGGRQIAYWREALAGLPEELPLPADRPRPARASYRGGTVPVDIPAALHAQLLEIAGQNKATMFMVLQAGFGALLGRLGGGRTIPVGVPVAGRTDAALDDVVGLFVNTLVLRVDLTGDPGFGELVTRVRETALEAYAHQDVPFDRLVEALNPERSLSRHPLFQVSMVLQNAPGSTADLPGLAVEDVPIRIDGVKFDLLLGWRETFDAEGAPAGLHGGLEYSADLFDEATAERVGRRLVRLLTAAVADPARPVGALEIMDEAERSLVLGGGSGTVPVVEEATLPELFERQAAATPGNVAVCDRDTRLSYAELNARANQLAYELIAAGAGPESLVAVALPRDAHLSVAVLAVLKTGAGYLPMDTGHPEHRVAFMLRDARPVLGLTTGPPPADAPGITWLSLNDPQTAAAIAARPTANPQDHDRIRPSHPLNAAYTIYTSGTTGTPKGVVVTHTNVT
ncbi:condensation domain-containing protein, partial [Streptomyces sp. DSM 44938]|nr:condensation domain-containing protein [Streptomyces sp. DSM 44938]